MWKSYKYLYYKLYKLFLRVNGKDDVPEYTAMVGIGLLVFFNLLSVLAIFNVYTEFWHFPKVSRGMFFLYVGIPYMIIQYFILVHKGKWKRIVKEFNKEKEDARKRGRRNVIFYMLSTLLLFILSIVLMVLKNEGVIMA